MASLTDDQAKAYITKLLTAISSARLLWQDDHNVCFTFTDSKSSQQRECRLSGTSSWGRP